MTAPEDHVGISVETRVVVIGLGYVGLPLAVRLATHFPTIGIDRDARRVASLRVGYDHCGEVTPDVLAASELAVTDDPAAGNGADIYIVTVPTPVDEDNRPDLSLLLTASTAVAGMLDPVRRPIVVYESTVYPGVTENECGAVLAQVSGLVRGRDFFLGYSPERINPGDRVHSVDRIIKVVAGETPEVTARLCALYDKVTDAGTYPAASIRVAEAAKVIENAQRDINIAFVNEVAQIMARLDLSVWDVLAAARTKWNFLPFQPGLVGGHCIGIDPYYLSHCAEALGHSPAVILAGRTTNDAMAHWVADRLCEAVPTPGCALVLGLTFKENVADLRNSKVADVIARLRDHGHRVEVHDPRADFAEARAEYGIDLLGSLPETKYDIVFLAVPHDEYRALSPERLAAMVRDGGVFGDLKNVFPSSPAFAHARRWTL
ncbi:nucleotide sugar dehydrogenase [Sphingomonas sp. PP-CC-3G-468]|uniref:nucleotide sugar dehydrogenase n=1 Tax=Sphingomonas sp. PP-CC-3G-468 TaxID=2135656 RepID=UPI0010DF11DE|nr:nucleotide sugar dehydrogenase [Sphingomonas sp. PP-CC-3G-468]TCM07496.1 UDP-N-acetyl-D-galactosamine dehydrogenase [Sphingomonas sp. PP-CC-3G-468]